MIPSLLLLITAFTLLYVLLKWRFSYWQRKGFPSAEAKIPCGALDAVWRRKRSLGMAVYDIYLATKEPVIGMYMMCRPVLLVRDAQLAYDIFTKDFDSFYDRGTYVDEDIPATCNLLMLKGNKWKTMRTKMRPFFTSGKLKTTFETANTVSQKMIAHLNEIIADDASTEVEMKGLMSAFALDIIAVVFFGLDVNSFANPLNEFFSLKKDINDPGLTSLIRNTAQFLHPNLEKFFVALGWKEIAPDGMTRLVENIIAQRDEQNKDRKDFIQLLLRIRKADNGIWSELAAPENFKSMPNELIAAQMFLYYVAGFETTASAIAFTIYELAQYPDVLEKLQEDIAQALAKHGQLSYESLKDMKYLDLCFMETVRKYPALPILNRECKQDYTIPGIDKIIPKGTPIVYSLYGVHRDNEYFPDALRYDPERFLEKNMNYNPVAYMPFGEGPRHCIAQLMGKMNVKIAIVQILTHFKVELQAERREIEIANYGVPIMPKGGVPVRLSKKKLVRA